jgi:hypothetical protein
MPAAVYFSQQTSKAHQLPAFYAYAGAALLALLSALLTLLTMLLIMCRDLRPQV